MSSNSQIQPGKYLAKVVDYWVDKTQANVPRINIKLKLSVDQNQNILQWHGSLATEKSTAIVYKTLEICGLKSRSLIGTIANGPESNALDLNREVEVDVVHENKTSREGKPYVWVSIAWINNAGGSKANAMAADEFNSFLAASGHHVDADVAKLTKDADDDVPPPWLDPLANMPF